MEDKKQANSEKVKRWAKRNPEKHREMNKRWIQANPERWRQYRREAYAQTRKRLRQQAIVALGGVCVSCGLSDIRCLQIDHSTPIKGKRMNDTTFYNSIVHGAMEGLQLLCANCHAIKTYENGEGR